jgi:GAF domain-containing protein
MVTSHPPDDHPSYDDDVAQLTRLLLSEDSFDTFLNELVHSASVATAHSCSITLRLRDQDPYTVVSTDEQALKLDEGQYAGQAGPCLEALATGVPVIVTDMQTETRWSPYPAQAAAMGARSSMSYPLLTSQRSFGALNLYAVTPLAPDAGLQARAAQLADQAAGAIAARMRIAEHGEQSASLRIALASRSVIDQAIGIIMAQQRCSAREAFALIRQSAQRRNIRLRDAAAQIVGGAERKSADNGGGRY